MSFDAKKPKAGVDGIFKGGFNALFVDGSVHFVPLTTGEEVLRSLFDPIDGKALPEGLLK